MLQSMNVFHQTTRPKLLYSPSFCHGRRIPHKPPFLVSFPATTEFNPKFLHFLQHSASKSFLVSPATKKFSSVLSALPRENEEFSSDNEEKPRIQEHEEHRASISSDNGEYVVREAKDRVEFWASAWLKAGLYEDRSHARYFGSYKRQRAQQELDTIEWRFSTRYLEPFMCIIAVRNEGKNVHMFKNVIGTLDFRVKYLWETYPDQELWKTVNPSSTFRKRRSEKYGTISNVAVAECARQQGVGSSMLKFAIETAKEAGIKQVFVLVHRDNKPALALYRKMGFEILAEETPHLEEHNLYLCSINLQLDSTHSSKLTKVSSEIL
ncbi:hypothetical protein MKW98_014129 [Papaver atlanticum]|uniref:N-acetyltransferase domain-containing protein n=1 Tax=Papaver atlanticum TaxID=357466 RepID=A0AAD4SIP9_9MAGN|nr:hypothetical protein MKW98_014129 [Papaver atlanticum]